MMLAQNPLFIVGFCTAFVWAGAAAHFLYKKDEVWSRALAVPFGVLGIQSIFWLFVCLILVPMFSYYYGFADAWMWLMGGSANPWWVASALGIVVGVIKEIRSYGEGDGIPTAIVVTLGGMLLYGAYLLLAWMVASIQNVPVNLG